MVALEVMEVEQKVLLVLNKYISAQAACGVLIDMMFGLRLTTGPKSTSANQLFITTCVYVCGCVFVCVDVTGQM